MKKIATLALILSIFVFPMNSYAGGGAGPNGPYDSSKNSELETGIWVVLMVVLGIGLYKSLKKGKEGKEISQIDSPEIDISTEVFVKISDQKITTTGELVVCKW